MGMMTLSRVLGRRPNVPISIPESGIGKLRMSPENASGQAVVPHRGMGEILDSNAYPGSNILDKAAPANASPSLSGGWDFTVA
jgi:hypothetical protein